MPKGVMVLTRRIEPTKPTSQQIIEWQTNLICKVELLEHWKLKSKFRFSLQNPPRDI